MKQITAFIAILLIFVFFFGRKDEGKQSDASPEAKKPNIIFMLTDDQRWDAPGYAGNDIIQTHNFTFGKPNLDNRYMYRTGFVGKFGVKVNEGLLDSLFDSHELTGFPYFVETEGKQVHLADVNGDHAIEFIKPELLWHLSATSVYTMRYTRRDTWHSR
jgi:hypothetical protein